VIGHPSLFDPRQFAAIYLEVPDLFDYSVRASHHREDAMPEKQKPMSEIVKKAAHFLKHPEEATLNDIKSMAARLMDDQRNDPMAHKGAAIKPKVAAPAPAKAPKKPKAA
jgi:hypothetical protein